MNKKGLLAGALVVVSVAAISIGSTFALLKDTTEAKVNVFTAAAGLEGQLKEDAFDGCDYGVARRILSRMKAWASSRPRRLFPAARSPRIPRSRTIPMRARASAPGSPSSWK